MQHRILFVGAARNTILAAAGWIDKLNLDPRAYASQITIEPNFKWIRRRTTTTFVGRTVVITSRRVRFALIRFSIHDPDAPAIRFPSWYAGREMLIGIGNALVVFLFELVLIGVGVGIAPAPEFLDKPFPFIVGCQFFKSLPLFVRNDISDVLLKPV